MSTGDAPTAGSTRPELTDRQHLIRIGVIWVVLSLIAMALVYFVWGPHLPPGTDSDQAVNQQFDNKVLATIATPVFLFIWVYFGYVIVNWRVKSNTPVAELVDGPALRGHGVFQSTWLVVTSLVVLSLFVFGTKELVSDAGAGTGSGPAPIWTPVGYSTNLAKTNTLVVQVIGQQWRWTFRYPQYQGVETDHLVIPVGQEVQFDVTSLDVIHSFWATNLGVKADANPGVNNIAFVKPTKVGPIDIRCAELCGLWHGAMVTSGSVVNPADFPSWMATQQENYHDLIPYLPPYADFYLPQADGGYYDEEQAPLPPPPGPTPSPSPSVIP